MTFLAVPVLSRRLIAIEPAAFAVPRSTTLHDRRERRCGFGRDRLPQAFGATGSRRRRGLRADDVRLVELAAIGDGAGRGRHLQRASR
jgi:hypothetical protein